MAYDKIIRGAYAIPGFIGSHDSKDHADDFANYFMPLDRMHHATMHDRYIAAGLGVSGTIGATEVVISSGVAVDLSGRMVVLADSGNGEIGDPSAASILTPVPVHVPLSAQKNKTVYITIQF